MPIGKTPPSVTPATRTPPAPPVETRDEGDASSGRAAQPEAGHGVAPRSSERSTRARLRRQYEAFQASSSASTKREGSAGPERSAKRPRTGPSSSRHAVPAGPEAVVHHSGAYAGLVEHAENYSNDANSIAIARFWDSVDDETYRCMWNEKRPRWLQKNQARCVFEADEVFLAKTREGTVIGMAWFGQRDDDLVLESGESIARDKMVEVAVVVHQDWRGRGFGKQLLDIREQYLREGGSVTHMLGKVYRFNTRQLARLDRAPGWQHVGFDQATDMELYLYALPPEADSPQAGDAGLTRTEPDPVETHARLTPDEDSESSLSEHSSAEFDLDPAARVPAGAPAGSVAKTADDSEGDDDEPLILQYRRKQAALGQPGGEKSGQQPTQAGAPAHPDIRSDSESPLSDHSSAEFASDAGVPSAVRTGASADSDYEDEALSSAPPSLNLDDDYEYIDARRGESSRQGGRGEAAASGDEIVIVRLSPRGRLPAKSEDDLPSRQLRQLVECNRMPNQSLTAARKSLSVRFGLDEGYITHAFSLKTVGGVGDDAAEKINNFRKAMEQTGRYVEGKRTDHPDAAQDILFWPPEMGDVMSRRAWLRSQDWNERRMSIRPANDAGLMRLKAEDYPRYQLYLIKKFNDATDRSLAGMMGLSKTAVSQVLTETRELPKLMTSNINAFRQKMEDEGRLRLGEKKRHAGPTEGLFFWPPEFDLLVSHAEWRASRAPSRGVSRDQLLEVVHYNTSLSLGALSVLMGLNADRLSAVLRENNPERVTERTANAITGAIAKKREQGKLSRERRSAATPKDVLCWPPGFDAITPEKRESKRGGKKKS